MVENANGPNTATRALRENSPDLLQAGLGQLIRDVEHEWLRDNRDLMATIAPLHDCARRIGLDPTKVFDEAARNAPSELASIIREFGKRTDITPEAFGYVIETTPSGPQYCWA